MYDIDDIVDDGRVLFLVLKIEISVLVRVYMHAPLGNRGSISEDDLSFS